MSKALSVKYVTVSSLKPDEKNSRAHTSEQINLIARSIKEFGWTVPILVDRTNKVVAGHARLEAAKQLGEKKVPVITLDHLTPRQRRAYVIADNRIAQLATWDEPTLADELRALTDEGFDIDLVGYSLDDLKLLEEGWAPDKELLDTLSNSGDGSETQAVVKVKCPYEQVDKVVERVRAALAKAGMKDVEVVRP